MKERESIPGCGIIERYLTARSLTGGDWEGIEGLLDGAEVGLWERHISTGAIRGSRQVAKILGIEPDEHGQYSQSALLAIVHPLHQKYMEQALESFSVDGQEVLKCQIIRPDGDERWVIIQRLFWNRDVEIGSVMDITRNQKIEIKLSEDLNYLQNILDGIPNPLFCKDVEGRYEFCNEAFARMLGARKEHIVGLTVYDIEPLDLARLYHDKDMELVRQGDSQNYESKVRVHGGEYRDFRFNKAAIRSSRGTVTGLVGSMTDVTELKQALYQNRRLMKMKEAMLEVSQAVMGMNDQENLMQLILMKSMRAIEKSNVGSVLLQGDDGYFRCIYSTGYRMETFKNFKLSAEELFISELSNGGYAEPNIINDIPGLVRKGCPVVPPTDSGLRILSSISTPIQVEGGPLMLVNIDSFEDRAFGEDDVDLMRYMKGAAEMALANLRLYQETLMLTQYDQMTHVFNRSHFEKVLKAILSHNITESDMFLYVIVDLDGIQRINGTYGTHVGDGMIRNLAQELKQLLGDADILGRTGGDEFSGVFFGKSRSALESELSKIGINWGDEPEALQFSYGIASFPSSGDTYDRLVGAAAEELRAVKKKKRNGGEMKS